MRTGRPRTFDRDEALEQAMHLFWRHGYEGTTLSQLTRAMGIAAPSLYAAFGSKEGLYREALDRYAGLPGLLDLSVVDTSTSAGDALRSLLSRAAEVMTGSGGRGCMITTGMVSGLPEHADIARDLSGRRDALRVDLAKRLAAFVAQDEADAYAAYLLAMLQGLSIQARDGADADRLRRIVEIALHPPA